MFLGKTTRTTNNSSREFVFRDLTHKITKRKYSETTELDKKLQDLGAFLHSEGRPWYLDRYLLSYFLCIFYVLKTPLHYYLTSFS